MNYKVIRSKRKSISLKIIDENNIKISAPLSMSNDKIKDFVLSKESWILKHISRLEGYKNKYNEVVNYKKYCIFGNIVSYNGNFKSYYQNLAKEYLSNRINELSKTYNFTYNTLKFKNLVSKWGSCDRFNNITLNYKLIFLDKEVIDYVLVHELCHTVFFNHKQNFHALLSSIFKNEKHIKNRLKEGGVLIKLKYWIIFKIHDIIAKYNYFYIYNLSYLLSKYN